jgi:hypothetical protein
VSRAADQALEQSGRRASRRAARLHGALRRVSSRPALWYVATTLALIGVWDGRFLLTRKIGIWDWEKETYTLEFLKSAMHQGSAFPLSFLAVPQTIANYPALFHSVSYWANPEGPTLSPFLVLLPLTSVPVFLKIAFFAHLVIGAAGVFFVGRKLRLRTATTIFLFVLVILNPWLLQHLAIGYTPWITICYAPLLVASLLGQVTVGWFLTGTLADSLILYEGGLHLFLWLNATIVLVALAFVALRRSLSHTLGVGLVLLGAATLTLPKLVAINGAYGGWHRPIESSYRNLHDLWGLLTDTTTPLYELPHAYHVYGTAVYDGAFFTGRVFVTTLVVLVGLLSWRTLRRDRHDGASVAGEWALLAVAAVWLILGWDGVWRPLTHAFGALGSEIYPFRFLAISVFLCAVFVVLELDRLSRINRWVGLACFGVGVAVAVTLWSRNDYFADVATSMPYASPVSDVQTFLDDTVTARSQGSHARLAVERSSKTVSVDPPMPRSDVRIEWLPTEHLHDFSIRNAHIVEQDGLGTTVALDDASAPVVFTARAYHRELFFFASAVLYGLLLGVVWALRPARPRRP